MNFTLQGATSTQSFGYRLGEILPASTVLLLSGDLGSGKTTFIQGLGAGLGITDAIASPTFTLICEYPEGRIPLYHFDLYRLQPQDIANLQPELYWEGIEFEPGIVAIEWAERLPYLPPSYLSVELHYPILQPADFPENEDICNDSCRRITLTAVNFDLASLSSALQLSRLAEKNNILK